MPSRNARVAFARINRRSATKPSLQSRPFAQDMSDLAASHRTETNLEGKRWAATDLEMRDDGQMMVGLLGYATVDQVRGFAEEDFSWLKGTTQVVIGARQETVVPFAVDLRDHRRWVAAAISSRIAHVAFATGLQAVLNAAVQHLGNLPTDWEVDPVTSRSDVLDWVAAHTGITEFRRRVRFSNPGLDLDDVRADMQALRANVHEETYRGTYGRTLQLRDNPTFEAKLEGLERGDIDVNLVAGTGSTMQRYSSKDKPDETFVDSFANLQDGMDTVLESLRVYSAQRADQTGIA